MDFFDLPKDVQIQGMMKLREYTHQGGSLADLSGVSEDEIKDIKHRAEYLYKKKQYKEAVAFANTLVLLEEKMASHWELLGLCLVHLKEYCLCMEAFCQSIKLDPTNPLPMFYIAQAVELALGITHETTLTMYKHALEFCQHTSDKNGVKKHIVDKIRRISSVKRS